MIDIDQEKEIIGAFERAGLPAGCFDFTAEIYRSLSLEENLSQLEEKTGFNPKVAGRKINRAYAAKNFKPALDKVPNPNRCRIRAPRKIERAALIQRLQKSGFVVDVKEGFNKAGEPRPDMIYAYKRNKASFAASSCKVEITRTECLPEKKASCAACDQWQVKAEGDKCQRCQDFPPPTAIKAPIEEAKEAPKASPEPDLPPKKWEIYEEGREYTKPVKGKDDLLYSLYYYTDDKEWSVDKMHEHGRSKHLGGYQLIEGCGFATYHEAWLFFLDCIEGKKPDCETWEKPKPEKKGLLI